MLNLHTKKNQEKYIKMSNTPHASHKKNDLSGLGLDPRIVVEEGEKWLRFALGSSQIPGNFQNFTFNNALANFTPPQS